MIYTLFFSRLRPEYLAEQANVYRSDVERTLAVASAHHDGFVDIKSFTAEDGERLTVVRFRDADSQLAWRRDTEHVEAQQRGRDQYYEGYRIAVCDVIRERSWVRRAEDGSSE